jgi:hypothetical protein
MCQRYGCWNVIAVHDLSEYPAHPEGFEVAVRVLAWMRTQSALRLACDPDLAAGLRLSTAALLAVAQRADQAMTALRPDLAGALDGPVLVMTARLKRLGGNPRRSCTATSGPRTCCTRPAAESSPSTGRTPTCTCTSATHLLIREGGRKLGKVEHERLDALPQLFVHETGTDPGAVDDQLVTCGLCWTMNALRWVVEIGVPTVQVSATGSTSWSAICASWRGESRQGCGQILR